jgi:hypothetical protein
MLRPFYFDLIHGVESRRLKPAANKAGANILRLASVTFSASPCRFTVASLSIFKAPAQTPFSLYSR